MKAITLILTILVTTSASAYDYHYSGHSSHYRRASNKQIGNAYGSAVAATTSIRTSTTPSARSRSAAKYRYNATRGYRMQAAQMKKALKLAKREAQKAKNIAAKAQRELDDKALQDGLGL